MEENKGFVYAMINPSYEGLVKIGKTTKDPNARAKELSSATGVATPFVVVYKRLFNDCSIAEVLIHRLLEERGCRVNKSREFFSIDISEAIDLILSISDNPTPSEEVCIDATDSDGNGNENENLAELYYNKGRDSLYGYNDTLQDTDMAVHYFTLSAQLGDIKSYLEIGRIYRNQDKNDQALRVFREGAQKGNFLCYAELGILYLTDTYFNRQNANLAWSKFFQYADTLDSLHWRFLHIADYFVKFIFTSIVNDENILSEHEDYIYKHLTDVRTATEELIKIYQEQNSLSLAEFYETKILRYLNHFEENYLLSHTEDDDAAERLYNLATKYYNGSEHYEKSVMKALLYYDKSAKLGYVKANALLGICWLDKDRPDKTDSEWKEFYNIAYDSLQTLDDQTRCKFLDGFIELFSAAIEYNRVDLLHPYYAYLSMHMGIVEHYTARIDKLNEMLGVDVEDLNIDNLSEEDVIRLLDAIAAKEEIEKLQRVHNYIKTIVAQIQSSNNSQVKFLKLT